jgi:hypothetical protein
MSFPSLYIPCVARNIDERYIIYVITHKLEWGFIKNVDIIPVKDKKYNQAFIHFRQWNPECDVKYRLLTGETIIYDDFEKQPNSYKYYWVFLINKTKKPFEKKLNSLSILHPVPLNEIETTYTITPPIAPRKYSDDSEYSRDISLFSDDDEDDDKDYIYDFKRMEDMKNDLNWHVKHMSIFNYLKHFDISSSNYCEMYMNENYDKHNGEN